MHTYNDAYYHSQHFDAVALEAIHRSVQEAQRLQRDAVEPEHLLLALVRQEGSVACELLREMGAPAREVKAQLDTAIGPGAEQSATQTPALARTSQFVIDFAIDESRRINQLVVGSEHLLLGILREGESPAATLLHQQGVTYERARTHLYRRLGA